MCHVYKFMCHSFVELKMKINTRSLLIEHWIQRIHRCWAPVVGLEEYSAHDWRAATSLQRAPVTLREWGLCIKLSGRRLMSQADTSAVALVISSNDYANF